MFTCAEPSCACHVIATVRATRAERADATPLDCSAEALCDCSIGLSLAGVFAYERWRAGQSAATFV